MTDEATMTVDSVDENDAPLPSWRKYGLPGPGPGETMGLYSPVCTGTQPTESRLANVRRNPVRRKKKDPEADLKLDGAVGVLLDLLVVALVGVVRQLERQLQRLRAQQQEKAQEGPHQTVR